MLVVVPARDEEDEIQGCLEALVAAARGVVDDGLEVYLVVVLHRCQDATGELAAEVAAAHDDLRWHLVPTDAPTLGEARAAGVEAGREASRAAYPQVGADELWVASTDADSRVPAYWLAVQRELADEGLDLVLGTVAPEEDGSEAGRLWHAQHTLADGHTAIHGANLGVRLGAYDRAGGFPALDSGEDGALVHRLRAGADGTTGAAAMGAEATDPAQAPWTSTDRTRVTTSARREGRAEQGFAGFLRRLDDVVSAHGVTEELELRLREEILRLAHERGPDKTLCPSEAAGAVDPDRRRALTHVARAVACGLADTGLVVITQRGMPVDGRTTPGPVRIRLAADPLAADPMAAGPLATTPPAPDPPAPPERS